MKIAALTAVLMALIAIEVAFPSADQAQANEGLEMIAYADFCPN